MFTFVILLICVPAPIIASPYGLVRIHDKWLSSKKSHSIVKRAIVALAPQVTFPDSTKPIAKYGDICHPESYNQYMKPIYDAAEQEDDNEYGSKVNSSISALITFLKSQSNTTLPNDRLDSWFQAVCFGSHPLICSTVDGSNTPTCRCLNSTQDDTPNRHHPHYIHEGGRCRVLPGGFCRDHFHYSDWARCAQGSWCKKYTCITDSSLCGLRMNGAGSWILIIVFYLIVKNFIYNLN